MRWLFALALLGGSSYYLLERYKKIDAPEDRVKKTAEVPGAELAEKERLEHERLAKLPPAPLLSVKEIKRIRRSADDPDPGVRWTSLALLFSVRDPEAVELLNKAASADVDSDVRLKAIGLLKTAQDVPILKLQGLIKALTDFEPAVRIAALQAIGDVGDAAAAPWVADVLKDPEPDVRVEALRAIEKLQDKRVAEQAALAAKLRADYEEAVKKAKAAQEQEQ